MLFAPVPARTIHGMPTNNIQRTFSSDSKQVVGSARTALTACWAWHVWHLPHCCLRITQQFSCVIAEGHPSKKRLKQSEKGCFLVDSGAPSETVLAAPAAATAPKSSSTATRVPAILSPHRRRFKSL